MKKAAIDKSLVGTLYNEEQKTPMEIARQLRITKSRVYQILDSLQIERRPVIQKECVDLRIQIERLFTVDKLQPAQIAAITGKHISTVSNHLKRLNLVHATAKNPRLFISKAELIELYIKQRLPASKIAEKYGITESCVYGKLSKFNIKNGVRDNVLIEEEDLRRMFITENMTAGEIAKIFDLKVQTVFSKLNKYKIKKHKPMLEIAEAVENLLTKGYSQRQIADELNVSQSTVSLTINKKNSP